MTDRSIPVETSTSEIPAPALDDTLAVLADGRRRTVLSELLVARGRVPVRVLATRVAATEAAACPDDVDEDRRRDVELSLRHVHLPKLRDAGLVDVADGEATATDRTGRLERLLERLEDAPSPDAVLSALADRRRRSALRHAARVDGSISLSALAARIADESDDERDDVALDLHHRHLPKLDDAGLLGYDASERRVDDAATSVLDDDALGDSSASAREDLCSHVPL